MTIASSAAWTSAFADPSGVAVEDLDNDGKTDIVVVGCKTRNIKVYLNERGK